MDTEKMDTEKMEKMEAEISERAKNFNSGSGLPLSFIRKNIKYTHKNSTSILQVYDYHKSDRPIETLWIKHTLKGKNICQFFIVYSNDFCDVHRNTHIELIDIDHAKEYIEEHENSMYETIFGEIEN